MPKHVLKRDVAQINLTRVIIGSRLMALLGLLVFAINTFIYFNETVPKQVTLVLLFGNLLAFAFSFWIPWLKRTKLGNNQNMIRHSKIAIFVFCCFVSIISVISFFFRFQLSAGVSSVVPVLYIMTVNTLIFFDKNERVFYNIFHALLLVIAALFLPADFGMKQNLVLVAIITTVLASYIGFWQQHLWSRDRLKSIQLNMQYAEKSNSADVLQQLIVKMKTALDSSSLYEGGLKNYDEKSLINNPLLLIDEVNSLVNRVIFEKNKAELSVKDYNELFSSTYDAFTYLGKDSKVLEANPAFFQLTGYNIYDGDEVYVKDLVHPDDLYESASYFNLLKQQGGYKGYQGRIICKDGTVKYVEVSSQAIFNEKNEVVGSKDIIRDITEAKRAQAELRQQLELDQMLNKVTELFLKEYTSKTITAEIENTLAGLGQFFDVDRCYIFDINMENETISNTYEWCKEGVSPEIDNLQDIPFSVLPWWVDELINKRIINISNIENIKDTNPGLYELLSPQGIKSLVVVPLIIKGKTIGFYGFDDITNNRVWTKQAVRLLEKSAEIFSLVSENHRIDLEKESLIEQLAVKNEELEDFAHVVSHDLKAPLRGIVTVVNWLKEDFAHKLNDEGIANLNLLENRALRLEQLINDILAYSALETERKDEVDLLEVLKEVEQNLSYSNRKYEIRYLDKMPVLLNYSYTRIYQLFQNLISNAINYNDKPIAVVEVVCTQVGKEMLLSVKDNGVGIEEKFQDKIFEIFQKLDDGNPNSTGIGLAIVNKIVKLYNGQIKVKSEPGKGTEFLITLPHTFKG